MTVNLQNVDETIRLFEEATAAILGDPKRDGSIVRLPSQGHLIISGDLHDHLIHLEKIRGLANLESSADRHVLLQELIHGPNLTHGCDLSYRMLGKVAEEILSFPGQVHVVLGNHELAQRTRSGVSKGGGNNVELFNDGLGMVFGADWTRVADAIDQFIDALPLAVITDSGLFCSHSLPAVNVMPHFDINILDRRPTDTDQRGPAGSAYLMVWGRKFTREHLQSLAEAWNVSMFCVGHAWVEMGVESSLPGLVAINSDHERGSIISWDLAQKPSVDELMTRSRYLQTIGSPVV